MVAKANQLIKKAEAHPHVIDRHLHNRVRQAEAAVGPRRSEMHCIGVAQSPDHQCHGVKQCWLLPKMVVVIGEALHLAGKHTAQLRRMRELL